MIHKETVKKLHKLLPGHNIAVNVSTWYFNHRIDGEEYCGIYSVSVLPGIDGNSCQTFAGNSVEDCYAKVVDEYTARAAGHGECF